LNSHFFAFVSRMRFITRWGLMHNLRSENVQEHSHMVAMLAHALAIIDLRLCGGDCDPGLITAAALYHDAPETFTGDMPTPVKYRNRQILGAFRQVENAFAESLVQMLPRELQPDYRTLLFPDEKTERFVKAADTLSAYIKCVEEMKAGNSEFKSAMAQTKRKLDEMDFPPLTYFMEHFLPSFSLTLDEME